MTRDELIAIAKRLEIQSTEGELDSLLLSLVKELPHGDIAKLLYHTLPELTIEQAVDEAISRQQAWERGRR